MGILEKRGLTPDGYKNLRKRGYTIAQIAASYSVSKTTVTNYVRRHGLTGYDPFDEKARSIIKKYKKLKAKYYSIEAIAEELGIPERSLYEIRKKYIGDLRMKDKLTPEQRAKAKENGISYMAVTYRLENGWPMELALTKPPIRSRFTKEQEKQIQESGLLRRTVVGRLERGYTFDEAISHPLDKRHPKYRRFTEEQERMIKASGIGRTAFEARIQMGYTFDEAINKPLNMRIKKYRESVQNEAYEAEKN